MLLLGKGGLLLPGSGLEVAVTRPIGEIGIQFPIECMIRYFLCKRRTNLHTHGCHT